MVGGTLDEGHSTPKIRLGYLTPAFPGAQKWAEMLHNPCILGTPTKGTKSELAASPLPSWGPKNGRKCYTTPAFSGVPSKREQNQSRKRQKQTKKQSFL